MLIEGCEIKKQIIFHIERHGFCGDLLHIKDGFDDNGVEF